MLEWGFGLFKMKSATIFNVLKSSNLPRNWVSSTMSIRPIGTLDPVHLILKPTQSQSSLFSVAATHRNDFVLATL